MNYFKLFNIPKKFKINKKVLYKNFCRLQLQYHPDLFLDDAIEKQSIVMKKSITINKGYCILKHDFKRAIYLLHLHGFNIDKKYLLLTNQQFLIKYFDLYEELDTLKKNKNNQLKTIVFMKKIEKKIIKYKKMFQLYLNNENWKNSIKIISKLLFFLKIKKMSN